MHIFIQFYFTFQFLQKHIELFNYQSEIYIFFHQISDQ